MTNSFGATKVAGNLSNGTIKLQLSFFSFFIADACILEARARCKYVLHRFAALHVHWCVSHILQGLFMWGEIVFLDECWVLLLEPSRNQVNLVQLWVEKRQLQCVLHKKNLL